MEKQRKKRISNRQAQRLRTLRANKTPEQISEDARRAGSLSNGQYDRERSIAANKKRWDAYRAKKAAEALKQQKGE